MSKDKIKDEIIKYYDYLMRLAISKCGSRSDAEDLASETVLAALAFLHGGGVIEYPKTWLTNTLYHKFNDGLRKKYRYPVTVCLDDINGLSEDFDDGFLASEDASEVRRELNFLGYSTREVMIRRYFRNQSVSDIAAALGIPKGTVKSRLFAGRSQMKKGLETMNRAENNLPSYLYLSYGGSEGLKNEPMSLVENDPIAQNLLILAYEKPISVADLSRAIGIPAAYIEPIVKKLVDGELMIETDGKKVYSDFIITKPEDKLKSFKPQLEFAHKHFDKIWKIIQKMSERISEMPFVQEMSDEQKIKLDRYAVLKALQDFQHFGTGKIASPNFPKRRDGGQWFAQAVAFEAGYDMTEYNKSTEYMIQGGHRTTESYAAGGTRRVRLCEFDTALWDNPARYAFSYDLYFKHIIPFLWCIYADIPLEERVGYDVPSELITHIPEIEKIGLIRRENGNICVSIPVLKIDEYNRLCDVIQCATDELIIAIGKEFEEFISTKKSPVPKHLKSVPELYRYCDAAVYFTMSVVREAYDKGLHLSGVNYCCPPVVMVWDACEGEE